MYVKLEKLSQVSRELLKSCDIPSEHVDIITDTILFAHKRGKPTHGIGRVLIYLRKIEEGLMNPKTPILVMNDFCATACLDAQNGFGQVAAHQAMNIAIEKSKQYGCAVVSVKHSNNFGTAGYFAHLAAQHKKIGIVISNSAPAISVGNGKPMLGTNPMSVSFPTTNADNPFIFDMAMSNAARGKIRLAAQNGTAIPEGWAVDKNGKMTTDPIVALEGTVLPIGGYKGVGLSMIVDVLAGLLSGAAFAGDTRNLNHPSEISDYGHLVCAIDIEAFMCWEDYLKKVQYFIEQMKKNDGVIPGEHSYQQFLSHSDMVYVDDMHVEKINQIALQRNINCKL